MQLSLNDIQRVMFGLKWDPVDTYRVDLKNRQASSYDLDLCALIITDDDKRYIVDYTRKNWRNQVVIVKDSIEGDYRKISEQLNIDNFYNIKEIYIGILSINSKVSLKDIKNLEFKVCIEQNIFNRKIVGDDNYSTAFIACKIYKTDYGIDYIDLDEMMGAHTAKELFRRVGWGA